MIKCGMIMKESRVYMNKKFIEKLVGNYGTYIKGEALYETGFILEYYEDANGINGEVESSNGYRSYSVNIKLKRGIPSEAYCDCPAFAKYNRICKHCVAVLLNYVDISEDNELDLVDGVEKGFSRNKIKPITDSKIKSLIYKEFQQEGMISVDKYEVNSIDIEPCIKLDRDGTYVEFKIGREQKYLIKDIYEFIRRFQEGITFSYGKKLEFKHSKKALNERGKLLFDYISEWADEYADSNRTYDYIQQKIVFVQIRSIRLYRYYLEKLILQCCNKSVMVTLDRNDKRELLIQDGRDCYPLFIDKFDGGIELQIEPIKLKSCKEHYISIDERGVIVFSKKEFDEIYDVVETMLEKRWAPIFIGDEDIPIFCASLLPKLRKNFLIRAEGLELSEYHLAECEGKIYIDMPQDNIVTIRAIACYGDQEVSVYNMNSSIQNRNYKKESDIAKIVNEYSTAYDNQRYEMVLDNDDLLYELLTEGVLKMQEVAEVFLSDAIHRLQPKAKTSISVGVAIKSGILEMDFKLENITMDEMIDVLSKYDKKKKYHKLKSGAFLQVEGSGLDEFSMLQETLAITDKQLKKGEIELPTYRTFTINEQLKNSETLQFVRDKNFKQLVRSMKTIEENDFEISQNMERILREYQKTGFLWMNTLYSNGFGGVLADDMGLGKTVQVIAFLESQIHNEGKKNLIITPASLVYNWKSEIEKFAPTLTPIMVVGTANERKDIIQSVANGDILITSYDLLKRDIDNYANMTFDIQIIDEAQYIKNANTQATRAVKDIHSKFRLALTGTPVENRLSELWSIFDFIMPGFLYSAKKFRNEFETEIIKNNDIDKMQRLTKMVAPFILRRKKKDVLKDLPDKVEENRIVLLEDEQKKIYDAYLKRLQMTINDKTEAEFNTSKIQILAELTRLRQICCDPRLFLDNYNKESAKLDMCIQLISNAVEGGHKILLFSQFTTMFDYIHERLKAEGISFYTITGAVSKEKRSELVNAFNTDDTSVFCISLKAGGTGLNLTSADIVIHYDPWWNVAVQDQATDRAHRIGQKQVVTVYKLIAKDTIEEKIIALQAKKKELADQILEGESISKASFSKEDLLEILS